MADVVGSSGRCHRPAVRPTAFVAALLLVGCAGSDPTGTPTELEEGRPDPIGATRASREAIVAEAASASALAPAPVIPAAPPRLFVARAIDATVGEDGHGETVPAVASIAFDLDARQFPARAVDPVLHVGELHFVAYTHPAPGVLRFVAADRSALPEGAEVVVQYGDDAATRRVVAPALELP